MADNQGSNNGVFSGEIDPEIAELIGVESEEGGDSNPAFSSLFIDGSTAVAPAAEGEETSETFTVPTELLEKSPKPFFADKDYYKTALSGEGEAAQRTHKLLSEFLACQDPKEKPIIRGKLVSAYWSLGESIASKIYTDLPIPKILLIRYGVILQTLLSDEQRGLLARIIFDNKTGETIYYFDEWLRKVAAGQVSPSSTDEAKPSQRTQPQRTMQLVDKAKGQRDVQLGLAKAKLSEIESAESMLKDKVSMLLAHDMRQDLDGMKAEYNAAQRLLTGEIGNIARSLSVLDRDLSRLYNELAAATKQLADLRTKADEAGERSSVDVRTVTNEFNTVRQMIKMCVGRQGNHFPILMKQYLRANIKDIGTRETVIAQMAEIEVIDPGLFKRTFKGQTKRIVPYIILVPCYGDQGMCWEPFERFNRATSRGRIAIPMFPTKDLKTAVITALADLRWQVEKEKAQHYWMEEGLTGNYYQWFSTQKLKGDVREYFIQDYVTWVTKESEGMQKLDREVRSVFWRYLAFPDDIKEKLKTRGFVYGELAKKDRNRAMSDGY